MLIEPYRQLRFGFTFITLNFFFSSSMLFVFGYYLWDVFEAITEYFRLDPEQQMVTANKFMVPVTAGLSIYALFIFTTLYVSARYTHQFYGPLVSIRRFLDDLLAGKKPAPIKLRTKDQLHDLVDRLNLLSDSLARGSSSRSVEVLNQYATDVLAGRSPELLKLDDNDPLKPLSTKLNQLATALNAKR
jgi:hypothetical protein